MSVGYYFLAWFVIGFAVALVVGRWLRRQGDTAQGAREVQFYNAYGRLELLKVGNFFVLRCAVCGQTFLQVRDSQRASGIVLPLSALQHQCPWIKKQSHKATKRQLKIGRHGQK